MLITFINLFIVYLPKSELNLLFQLRVSDSLNVRYLIVLIHNIMYKVKVLAAFLGFHLLVHKIRLLIAAAAA